METTDRNIAIATSQPMSLWAAIDAYGKRHGLNRSEVVRRAAELLLRDTGLMPSKQQAARSA